MAHWVHAQTFPQYQAFQPLRNNSLFCDAELLINGQWLLEYEIALFGMIGNKFFEKRCAYAVHPRQRHYYLFQYYHQELRTLEGRYNSFLETYEHFMLTNDQKRTFQKEKQLLENLISRFEYTLVQEKEWALPKATQRFFEALTSDPRLLFIVKRPAQDCLATDQSLFQQLPSLEDPAILSLYESMLTIKKISDEQERESKCYTITATAGYKPPFPPNSYKQCQAEKSTGNKKLR